MSILGDRLTALLASCLAVVMGYLGWSFPANGDVFPKFICGSVLVVSLFLAIRTVSLKAIYDRRRIFFDAREELLPLLVSAAFVAYVFAIFVLGYYTATLIFLVALSVAIGIRRIVALAVTAALTLPLLYAFFELFLGATMPTGLLI